MTPLDYYKTLRSQYVTLDIKANATDEPDSIYVQRLTRGDRTIKTFILMPADGPTGPISATELEKIITKAQAKNYILEIRD